MEYGLKHLLSGSVHAGKGMYYKSGLPEGAWLADVEEPSASFFCMGSSCLALNSSEMHNIEGYVNYYEGIDI